MKLKYGGQKNEKKNIGMDDGSCRYFVDKDGDGICDNYAARGTGRGVGRGRRGGLGRGRF